jgi:carbamoyl-phosphate synthase large subunit
MKSVGEVMALGRSFPEALQKAVRMLNIGAKGLSDHPYNFPDPKKEIYPATDRRLYAVYDAMRAGVTLEKIHDLSKIDMWFLYQLQKVLNTENTLKKSELTDSILKQAKQNGFSDYVIGKLTKSTEQKIRAKRITALILSLHSNKSTH